MVRRAVAVALVAAASAIAPAAADNGGDWTALHRPLALPALSPDGACPVSESAPEISGERYGVGGAIGSGPVFAMLGSASLVAYHRPQEWGRGVWAGQKVFWLVVPAYDGPVLIRGRRLGGWQWLRFDRGSKPSAELRLAPGETVTWSGQAQGSRGRPSYVRVRAPGCYAAQIDGSSFSTVVVFRVDISRAQE